MTTSGQSTRVPGPLLAAVALVGVEGVALAAYGLVQLTALTASRATMTVTTTVFFVGYGVALGALAWALRRLVSWARAPVVLAQLIQLGVAWSFRGGSTTPVAVLTGLLALLVLAGIFHPASLAALADDEPGAA